MCTVSWLPEAGGYVVGFNRDERYARRAARPPAIEADGTHRVLLPRDGEAGGSWIAANDAGITVALANRYAGGDLPPGRVSRGLLVTALAMQPSRELVWQSLQEQPLAEYAPFTLLAFAPDAPPLLMGWDGATLDAREADAPGLVLSSSSFEPEATARRRREAYDELVEALGGLDAAVMTQVHATHEPAGPASLCVHRPLVGTVSFTRVDVGAERVRMTYVPGAPCRTAPLAAVVLDRPPEPVPRVA